MSIRVEVDNEQCKRVADLLRRFGVPRDEEDTALPAFTAIETSNFYLMLVAICHQTQGLRGSVGRRALRGWDYLSQKLLEACAEDRSLLEPMIWSRMTPRKSERFSSTRLTGRRFQIRLDGLLS